MVDNVYDVERFWKLKVRVNRVGLSTSIDEL